MPSYGYYGGMNNCLDYMCGPCCYPSYGCCSPMNSWYGSCVGSSVGTAVGGVLGFCVGGFAGGLVGSFLGNTIGSFAGWAAGSHMGHNRHNWYM